MITIEATQKILVNVKVENITEFYEKYPGSTIMKINGKNAHGICEECECAISNGDQCYEWNGSVYTCFKCGGSTPDHEATKFLRLPY